MFDLVRILTAFTVAGLISADGTWTLDKASSATIVAGVGAASSTKAIAGASQNGVGSYSEQFNGQTWSKTKIQSGMLLDAAITDTDVAVTTGLYTVFVSQDGAKTFTPSTSVAGVSQNANVFGANSDKIALVGSWVQTEEGTKPKAISGVAVSTDGGNTFTLSSSVPAGYVRYGAFPSDNTWYISSGIWGNDPKVEEFELTSRLTADKVLQTYGSVRTEKPSVRAHPKGEATGWFGAVSKTTDGGKTWTKVFGTDVNTDYIYFNGISCSSETNCVVVGEGDDAAGNYLVVAYTTFDGGNTWQQTLTANDVGLMSAKFVSATEGWLAGSGLNGRKLEGKFWHTTDSGKTFQLQQSLDDCYVIDMDFRNGGGYAACSSSSGSSCTVAVYK